MALALTLDFFFLDAVRLADVARLVFFRFAIRVRAFGVAVRDVFLFELLAAVFLVVLAVFFFAARDVVAPREPPLRFGADAPVLLESAESIMTRPIAKVSWKESLYRRNVKHAWVSVSQACS